MIKKKTVTLEPHESKIASFEVIPTEAGVYGVSVNGLSGSFTAREAPPATGVIILYGENFPVRGTDWNWTAYWDYADGSSGANPDDYAGWRGPSEACTPAKPIPLNNLLFMIQEGSYEYGYTGKHFGPFVVENGKSYVINWVTGELRVR